MVLNKVGEYQTTVDVNNGVLNESFSQSSDSTFDVSVSGGAVVAQVDFQLRYLIDTFNNDRPMVFGGDNFGVSGDGGTDTLLSPDFDEVRVNVIDSDEELIIIAYDENDNFIDSIAGYAITPDTGWFDPSNLSTGGVGHLIYSMKTQTSTPVTVDISIRKTVSAEPTFNSITKS